MEFIALNSDGCARDSESMLQQIISMSDEKITLKDVQSILGIADIKSISALIDYIADNNLSAALSHINELKDNGRDLNQFAKSCVNYLRKIMLIKIDPALAKIISSELTKEQLEIILAQAQKLSEPSRVLDIFIRAQQNIKISPLPQLALEMAVVESGQIGENNVK